MKLLPFIDYNCEAWLQTLSTHILDEGSRDHVSSFHLNLERVAHAWHWSILGQLGCCVIWRGACRFDDRRGRKGRRVGSVDGRRGCGLLIPTLSLSQKLLTLLDHSVYMWKTMVTSHNKLSDTDSILACQLCSMLTNFSDSQWFATLKHTFWEYQISTVLVACTLGKSLCHHLLLYYLWCHLLTNYGSWHLRLPWSIQCHLQLHKSQKHCPPSLNSTAHWLYKQLVGILVQQQCKLDSKSPRNTALVLLRLFLYKLVEATSRVPHVTTQRLTNTFPSHLWSSYQTSQ